MERDAELHKKVDQAVTLLTGNGKPEDGLVLKADRTARLSEQTAEQIADLAETVTDLSVTVRQGYEDGDVRCNGRARDVHKRLDGVRTEIKEGDETVRTEAASDRERVRTEVEHDHKVLAERLHKTEDNQKAQRWWIRGALWIGGPVLTLAGLALWWALQRILDRVEILGGPPPVP